MSKTVLITGASSGIGWELARRCAREGHRPVLVARSEDKLAELAELLEREHGTEAAVLPTDLTESNAAKTLVDRLGDRDIRVDWLVNNAGFGYAGPFEDNDFDKEVALLQVNVVALMALCRLLGARMVDRGSGRILNVASTAAFVPGPLMANYYASKAYVVSLSLALREEWAPRGVAVSVLCPGPTQTRFFAAAGAEKTPIAKGAGGGMRSPEDVADTAYRGMTAGKAIIIPGMGNRFGAFATRLVSRPFLARATMKYNRSSDA